VPWRARSPHADERQRARRERDDRRASTRSPGVGNIYANEALFRASIHPETPASSLSRARVKRLNEAIVHVLEAERIIVGKRSTTFCLRCQK